MRRRLQRRLDVLVRRLALAAGVIVAAVFALGLLRHEPIGTLVLTAVSLAVAAISESLPAVRRSRSPSARSRCCAATR